MAFIVCKAFGFDTSEYSVGYVGVYDHGDKRRIRQSVERITRTAGKIIEEIDRAVCSVFTDESTAGVHVPGNEMESHYERKIVEIDVNVQ
ncbi:hypothetical protein [Alicyclobacillus vulcanalis]|uniref:Uncharacterized protein n=1 Tax=Alicyclobacillus vulcanalis TaxID=252246 RepID=A0A1N7NIG6_9BACL|nr:hypothetical protein [Alicyclobacillus vulcanalis]SIS98185.1 hypothetical protein SAMN05421799_108160 [Alicyclobacillus vulcanalis]